MTTNQVISTPLTRMLGIKHPVMLAGMGVAAGPVLAAAVTNAGGIGVIGGHGYNPEGLREQIAILKSKLHDPNGVFGVDLLIPKVGGNARKTNYDYNKGKLRELIQVMIDSGAKLFVSAVGTPPKEIVEILHRNRILYMNMIGHPKHVARCLENDVDILCAQAGEGGGHTGEVPLSILIPAVTALTQGKMRKFTGTQIPVVAAGGIFNGSGLAAALMLGASAVWVGTRFITAVEAGSSKAHQDAVLSATVDDTVRTIIFSGRPMRVRKTPYIMNWENNRQDEIRALTSKGIRPVEHDADTNESKEEILDNLHPYLMGVAAGMVKDRKPAKDIVNEIVDGALTQLSRGNSMIEANI